MQIVILVLAIATVLNSIYIAALRSANDRLWRYLRELSGTITEILSNEKDLLKREKGTLTIVQDIVNKLK